MNLELGEATLEVVGPFVLVPTPPNDEPTFNWTTNQLQLGTRVWMVNNTKWRVSRPPAVQYDGRTRIILSISTRMTTTFLVSPDDLDLPIWNVGEPVPPPPPVDPPDEPSEPPVEPLTDDAGPGVSPGAAAAL